jgi:hypothetical protein
MWKTLRRKDKIMTSFEEFSDECVKADPENAACYTMQDM